MKKSFLFLFVFVMLASQSLVQLHAQEIERSNHYTQVIVYFAMKSVSKESEMINMSEHTFNNAKIKQIMENTDTTMNLQQRGFGPYPLEDDPARDSILNAEGKYGKRTLAYRAWSGMNQSLQNPQHPLSQKIQQIKDLTGAQVITIVIMVNADYYVSYSQFDYKQNKIPIMVATSGDKDNYLELYNQVIFDETSTKAVGYVNKYPEGHIRYPEYYATALADDRYDLPIYPRKGLYKDEYGFWLQVGDDDHNVLDPDHGWKLDYLYNKGDLGTALGFRTTPDTLTIKQDMNRHIELYPGWNDENVGEILYIAGERFFVNRNMYPNEEHFGYDQVAPSRDTDLGAYAVAINGIPDAFAMDYILVQFVPEIEYPTLQVPENIKVNDTFTVSLAGNPELMTSWEPEINISGIDYEFISTDKYTYKYKALSAGQANITLHHNSLLVLEDETHTIDVLTSVEDNNVDETEIQITPNPAGDYIEIRQPSEGLKPSEGYSVRIFNVLGVCLITSPPTPLHSVEGSKVRIDVSGLAPGVYFVRVAEQVQKFVKM